MIMVNISITIMSTIIIITIIMTGCWWEILGPWRELLGPQRELILI
jgi:hypothetical protein